MLNLALHFIIHLLIGLAIFAGLFGFGLLLQAANQYCASHSGLGGIAALISALAVIELTVTILTFVWFLTILCLKLANQTSTGLKQQSFILQEWTNPRRLFRLLRADWQQAVRLYLAPIRMIVKAIPEELDSLKTLNAVRRVRFGLIDWGD